MAETLFSRLASYSQNPAKKSLENFTTEVLAYLINSDRTFRRIFIRHIIRDKRKLRSFKCASARPQQSFGNGIVDLVLSSGNRKVLVEVKIGASETETKIYGRGWVRQVKKYLSYKEGPVAYLTTKAASAPDVNSKQFLGHFFFEDLYEHLTNVTLTLPGQLFREFMEENGMKPLEPFTQGELGNAQQAFGFAKKCECLLDEIKSAVEPEFRKLFRTRTGFKGGHFSPSYVSAYIGTRNFTRGNVKAVWIWIEPEGSALNYGVSVSVNRSDMGKLNRVLAWEEGAGDLWRSHPIRPNTNSRNCIKRIMGDLEHLQYALKRVY
jgi:hypothetical protein